MLPDLVSKAELIEILNQRMRLLPHGKNATVSDVIRLRHPDYSGCNWVPNFAATTASLALLDVFATARSEFLLKEE